MACALISLSAINNNLMADTSLQLETETVAHYSPIGDNINVEVYDFIARALISSNLRNFTRNQLNEHIKQQLDIPLHYQTDKPYIANIYEGQDANLLRLICGSQQKCSSITIYNKYGLGIITTGEKTKPSNDIFQTGTLGKHPQKTIGSKNVYDNQGISYTENIKYILRKENRYEMLSAKAADKRDKTRLLGYIRYTYKN